MFNSCLNKSVILFYPSKQIEFQLPIFSKYQKDENVLRFDDSMAFHLFHCCYLCIILSILDSTKSPALAGEESRNGRYSEVSLKCYG